MFIVFMTAAHVTPANSISLEVQIKKHKCNLMKCLLEESKLTLHANKQGHQIVGKKLRVYKLNPTLPTGNTRTQHTCLWQLI
jgi:NAD-dependent SIR2 family protein deacetylase